MNNINIDLKIVLYILHKIQDLLPLTVTATISMSVISRPLSTSHPATNFIGTNNTLLTIRIVFKEVHESKIYASEIIVECEGDKALGLSRVGASAETADRGCILIDLTTSMP